MGASEVTLCDEGDSGQEEDCISIDGEITVTADAPEIPHLPVDPGPPPGAGPGEGDPGPGPGPAPEGGGGGSDPFSTSVASWSDVISTTDRCGGNFDKNDRLGSTHGGVNTIRPDHSGVDIQGNEGDPVYVWRGGSVSLVDNPYCGYGVDIHHAVGSTTRYCHFDARSSFPGHDNRVRAGDLVGHIGRLGRGVTGFHVHITHTLADNETKIEYFSALPADGRPTPEQLNENGC